MKTSHLVKELLDEVRQLATQDGEYMSIMRSVSSQETDRVDKRLSVSEELLWFNGRLYIPNNQALKVRLLEHEHDSKIAGHFRREKTHELMTRNWYWPDMEGFTREYIRTCDSCQHNVSRRHKKYGLLQPLELAYMPWTSISSPSFRNPPASRKSG